MYKQKNIYIYIYIYTHTYSTSLSDLLAAAPVVTGTKTITYIGTAGYAAMSGGERTAMVAAFLAKGYTLD